MDSFPDHHRRLLFADLSDTELRDFLTRVRDELERLASVLRRDRLLMRGVPPAKPVPLGKLPKRIARTGSKWNEYRARQSAAELELRKRSLVITGDWDEPTLTDLERLVERMRRDAL